MSLKANNINELYVLAIKDVFARGSRSEPRGHATTEVLGAQLLLEDANNGLCTLASRKLNYAFGFVEACEHLMGVSDPVRLTFYNKNIARFLNGDGVFDGAYGPRIGQQVRWAYSLLASDEATRQAVLTFRDQRDCRVSKDVPCTLSLQFLLRDGQLNAIGTMRSNDLLWGFPYDVFSFTLIQRALASWLGVKVGWYLHQPGSLHVYDKTRSNVEAVVADPTTVVPVENPVFSLTEDETTTALTAFFDAEKAVRTGDVVDVGFPEPFKSFFTMVSSYARQKNEAAHR